MKLVPLIAMFLAACAFLSAFMLHWDYPYPYHQDEWQHLAISSSYASRGYNDQINPYSGEPFAHYDLESGFHLLVSGMLVIEGSDGVLMQKYLAGTFNAITCLILFFSLLRILKDLQAAAAGAIAFIMIPTNVNILGKDYFLPLTVAFLLVYMFFGIVSDKNIESGKKTILAALICLSLLFVYPPALIMVLVSSAPFFAFNFRKVRIGWWQLALVACGIAIIAIFIWKGHPISSISYMLGLLVFEPGWGKLETTFFIPALFGFGSMVFAAIGLYSVFYGNAKRLKFFGIAAMFALGITAFFIVFRYSVVLPYSRAVLFSMLSLCPLAGAGFLEAKKYIEDKLHLNAYSYLLLLVLLLNFIPYQHQIDYSRYKQAGITDADYAALMWAKDNLPKGASIAVPYLATSAVYPISGLKVLGLVPGPVEAGSQPDAFRFFSSDCETQKTILIENKVQYIISRSKLACSTYKVIYSENDFIYQLI
ncbi:MAG: hypothetical protein HGA85_04500 [Nanoarchaeota archaeon]|nr:hypothetical protein [Nanoarchaeota archaeon]